MKTKNLRMPKRLKICHYEQCENWTNSTDSHCSLRSDVKECWIHKLMIAYVKEDVRKCEHDWVVVTSDGGYSYHLWCLWCGVDRYNEEQISHPKNVCTKRKTINVLKEVLHIASIKRGTFDDDSRDKEVICTMAKNVVASITKRSKEPR